MACRYYANGFCRNGARCSFSHDPKPTNSQNSRNARAFARTAAPPPAVRPQPPPAQAPDDISDDASYLTPPVLAQEIEAGIPEDDLRNRFVALPSFWMNVPSDSPAHTSHYFPHDTDGPGESNLDVDLNQRAVERLLADNSPLPVPVTTRPFDEDVFIIGQGMEYDFSDPPAPPRSYLEVAHSNSGPSLKAATTTTTIRQTQPFVPNPTVTSTPPSHHLRVCQFHVAGNCRYGQYCRYVHGGPCYKCGRNCISPYDQSHVGACVTDGSLKQECNICFESTATLGRRFGLLNSCNHVFCLECIRGWRSSIDRPRETVRGCPVCRIESHFVIPCDHLPDADEKDMIILDYQSKVRMIPCRYYRFEGGESSCPFGSSCFYAHLDALGNPVDPAPTRKYVNADGEVDIIKAVRLSEFL